MSGLDLLPKSPTSNTPVTPSRHKLLDSPDPRIGHTRVEDEADIEKTYILGEILGKGGFGVVLEVEHRISKVKYAMKIVNKDKPGSISIQLLEREVEVLKRVNHSNIIRLEEVFETSRKMFMIMELCKGGELSAELKRRHYFKENDAKTVMRQIVEAVVFMHDCDMVHRDLKLDNVLISTADPAIEFNIKVTDFGLCYVKGLPGCEVSLMDNKCGTLLYMAPEVIRNQHDYTKMCDVWSLGVIMYCLLCGRYPYRTNSSTKLEEMIFSGQLDFTGMEWDNVTESAKSLISNMMCIETTDRFTARRILDDVWFTGQEPKKFLNAMDLMRDMASEQAKQKLRESITEQQDVETDIIISCPSGSLEPSGTFTTSPVHSSVTTEGEQRVVSARSNKIVKIKSAASLHSRRPVTQGSPSKPSTLRTQPQSTSTLSSPTRHGTHSGTNQTRSQYNSHTPRQRYVSESGSKSTLSISPSHKSTGEPSSSRSVFRERSYTTNYQNKKVSEGLSPIGSNSSHMMSNSRRHSATLVPGTALLLDSTTKRKSGHMSSTCSLSPSTSPAVSPRGTPRSSPRTSPTSSPKVSPRASPSLKKKGSSRTLKKENSEHLNSSNIKRPVTPRRSSTPGV